MSPTTTPIPAVRNGTVFAIGGGNLTQDIKSALQEEFLLQGLESYKPKARSFPTELFYYGDGLRLWQDYGEEIARCIPEGCLIVDMGSGDIRIPAALLSHIDKLGI
ncbi:hypothetical protein BJX70DRAFT_397442 [Aspergillus crustosus]